MTKPAVEEIARVIDPMEWESRDVFVVEQGKVFTSRRIKNSLNAATSLLAKYKIEAQQ